MNNGRRLVFKIDAVSKETIPLLDLAAYIDQFAKLLGSHDSVHLHDVQEGSLTISCDVGEGAFESVQERVSHASQPDSDPSAYNSYRELNAYLKRDQSSGVVSEGTNSDYQKIIEIPGIREENIEMYQAIWEAGNVDGIPTRFGGKSLDPQWIPILLNDNGTVVNCEAKPEVAVEIIPHFLKVPIRASGQGRWVYSENEGWRLAKFRIEQFVALDNRPLAEAVAEIREVYVGTDWAKSDDPITQISRLRNDE